MEREYWAERWQEGRIGFHEGHANGLLERNVARLGEKRRVLVPLCGKSEDMAFLAAHGHTVVGVELAEEAARAFFREHALEPTKVRRGAFDVYSASAITILVGDFFDVTREDLGPIDALYDRAAMIALPAEMRARYAAHVRGLLDAGTPGIVITLEYEQSAIEGPPFAVMESELRFAQRELLGEKDAETPRFHEAGVAAKERAFFVRA